MTCRSIIQRSLRSGVRQPVAARTGVVRGQFHHSAYAYKQPGSTFEPTHESRTSPKQQGSGTQHPGYTSADTPVTDAHPSSIPGSSAEGTPSGQARLGSTVAGLPHQAVEEMAEGAKIGGEDAIKPEDRNVKNWGPNQRSPEFNSFEGRRNPVRDGGSNEGGHDSQGKSKT